MPDAVPLDLLQWPLRRRDDTHIIGWRGGVPVDNGSFQRQVLGWRDRLLAHPGQRFALFHADTLHFAAALFGAWLAAKTVYLPGDALPDTCGALARDVDAFIGEFEPTLAPLPAPAPAAPGDAADWPPLAPSFAALVVSTSGTTGHAQAIAKSMMQLASEVATLEALFGQQLGQAEIVSTVSHQHIYGLLFKVLWPLAAGRPVQAHSAFFPEDLRRLVPPRPWALLSSPAHLKRFPEQPTRPETRLLQALFSSGGPLTADAARGVQEVFGQRALEVYGSSETGGIAWRQPHVGALRAEHWQPMPGVEVRAGADATLEVRSPHLPDGQWFAMADRASLDVAGFTLHGRADRIVKLEEKRISLDQIERLLLASPLVAECRVLVHEGRRQRQLIAAFVVPTAAGRVLLAQGRGQLNAALRTILAGAIEGLALPRLWRYLDAMPVNAQGKLTQAALSALLDAAPTPPARPTQPQVREIERSQHRVVLALQVPLDLLYFDGHFPATPILPGVVQTDWALSLGRRYFALPPRFLGLQALKFQRVIVPGASVTLELQHDTERQALSFQLHSEGQQHASGRFLLGHAA
ncbi:AMP-binding protein [Herbaspirillum sp. YR522]|uniref:AMP-binding protein n=1 Tax=Herbaspirillum sp. YR522 TaxID=1144342 RepID=UPI00026F5346|nr:AMP-binding protein [Herbaspirillum sp. YR522]EJN09279.1 acyl-CoA synthetase/AMP-acid ligase [Herbaspirillum sp. YR522]